MAVPTYEALMRPVLEALVDGEPHKLAEVREVIASKLRLDPDDLSELLPSGTQPTFNSRVHWARMYLERAGAVTAPQRGVVAITPRGTELVRSSSGINTARLAELFPEFREWRKRSRSSEPRNALPSGGATVLTDIASLTPEEALQQSFEEIKRETIEALLERVKAMPPSAFEHLVVELLTRLGYGGAANADVVGRSGDGGIDGVIRGDRLGLEMVYVQAKRWEANVGSPVVREFAGSLSTRGATKGVLITTSDFTTDARLDAERVPQRIILINGTQLGDLLFESELGVTTRATYAVKHIDIDYFEMEE